MRHRLVEAAFWTLTAVTIIVWSVAARIIAQAVSELPR